MAAPTNVRVEANSTTTAIVRWTDNGSNVNHIFRSTDNMTFAEVGSVVAGVQLFLDTELEPATRYWYKITNDGEVSFSSTVNVTTHTCVGQVTGANTFAAPVMRKKQVEAWRERVQRRKARNNPAGGSLRGAGGPLPPQFVEGFQGFEHEGLDDTASDAELQAVIEQFNNLSIQVEEVIGGLLLQPGDCLVCANNGAVVIDCNNKDCENFVVIADQDINSITVDQSCNPRQDRCGKVDISFIIPAGATRSIGGWPAGCGFDGDEGEAMPIAGGPIGRTIISVGTSTPGYGKTPSGGTGGGGGGGGCNCVPGNRNQLTVKCCSDDCSMNCQSTKELKIKICGGRGPYNVSASGSVAVEKESGETVGATDDIDEGQIVVIKPPANAGSAVAGIAYIRAFHECTSCSGGACVANSAPRHYDIGCDDVIISGTCQTAAHASHCTTTASNSEMECLNSAGGCLPQCAGNCNDGLEKTCDDRDAGQIAAGCNPCGVSASGQTVTVTDAVGTSVVTVLGA